MPIILVQRAPIKSRDGRKGRISPGSSLQRRLLKSWDLSQQKKYNVFAESGKKGKKIMTNEEMRNQTLEVVQLSEKAPVGIPGPLSWGGGQDGAEMVTFQQEDGWYGYQRGTKNGLFSEGEDQGPFDSREDAEAELRSQYEESKEVVNS
jgi:hypothetical protein